MEAGPPPGGVSLSGSPLVFVGIYGASVASLHNPVRTDPDRRARIKFHRALLSAPIFILRHVFVSQ